MTRVKLLHTRQRALQDYYGVSARPMAHSQGICFHLQAAWSKHTLTRPGADLQAAVRVAISEACMVLKISFFFSHFLS